MKLFFISFFVLIFFSVGFVESSQGDLPKDHPSLAEVSLQFQLRNSEGVLIAYFEPTLMYIINLAMVHENLDTQDNKTVISIEQNNFEVIQYQEYGTLSGTNQYSSYNMVYKGEHILAMRHDGYLSQPGDYWIASWKIIRPLS